ncbi:hypothetical protein LSAT2_019879 [Lamellibrachia satsuma]|nr:hypothetical protein LSAT2_019879 [Lamellibrachia satsuma]
MGCAASCALEQCGVELPEWCNADNLKKVQKAMKALKKLAEMSPNLALLPRVEIMVENNSGILIDVRNPEEVKDGKIGNAINVPPQEIPKAFVALSDEDFKVKYGEPKPSQEEDIVLYSASRASAFAVAIILKNVLKYQKVSVYAGGWMGWSAKHPADGSNSEELSDEELNKRYEAKLKERGTTAKEEQEAVSKAIMEEIRKVMTLDEILEKIGELAEGFVDLIIISWAKSEGDLRSRRSILKSDAL